VPRVPILEIDGVLIATVQEELRDRDALALQEELAMALERSGAHGVMLDLSVVETVDSFLGRLVNDIALGTGLLGAHSVIVGIQPSVAITLVEMGLELRGIRTALNVGKGMAILRQLVAEEAYRDHQQF
jgi:rsbT antagonist protein RsbS